MAAGMASRLLRRSFGCLQSKPFCNFTGLYVAECAASAESLSNKGFLSFLGGRRFTTTEISAESDGVAFPAELLSKKVVVAAEREIGLMQDLLIPATNFHNEDKGFMILPGDVFDLPIRKDIVHRVVRCQLAKRQQLTELLNECVLQSTAE